MLRLHAPWGAEDDGADAEEDAKEDVAGSGISRMMKMP